MREAPYKLNLVKSDWALRDARWEIRINDRGDFGFNGSLLIRHRQLGDRFDWPGAADDLPIAARIYDLEDEAHFHRPSDAMRAATRFLERFGAGDVEYLEWDISGQRYVVVGQSKRHPLEPDREDPLSAFLPRKRAKKRS